MFVAYRKQLLALARQKFVRSPVAAALFHERERAIIDHDVLPKKFRRRSEPCREQSPQTFAADFASMAIKSQHRPFWVFLPRALDFGGNSEPVAHRRDLPERNTGLGHAEWARIHAEKDHALSTIAVSLQIPLVRAPGVVERVVNMRHRRREFEPVDRGAECLCSSD